MAPTPGVYTMEDLLAARFSTANSIGLDTINTVLQKQLAYDNAMVDEMLRDFAEPTTAQRAIWGTYTTGEMARVDQYGHAMAQKFLPGITAGFPLYKFAYELGWNDDYFKRATGAQVAKMYMEARDAYLNSIRNEILRSLTRSGTRVFVDAFTDQTTYNVFPMWNGDAQVPPPSPAGAVFAGAHLHYNFAATFTAANVQATITHVEEHGNTRGVKLYIPQAQRAAVLAMVPAAGVPGCYPLPPAFLVETQGDVKTKVNNTDLEDQCIGLWTGGEEVWVKPWMVANYALVVATGMDEKALLFRQPAYDGLKGLRIEAPLPDYPLYAQEMTAQFGFGVFNRGMAAMWRNNAGWADMV